jgi:hypothetical protein
MDLNGTSDFRHLSSSSSVFIMSLSLDLSSLSSIPKWRSDWSAAEHRAIEHARALRSLNKTVPEAISDWVIKWVAVVVSVLLDSVSIRHNARL